MNTARHEHGSMGPLSDRELDAVVGGMMNNGQGQFLQTPKNTGGTSSDPGGSVRDLVFGAIAFTIFASL